MARRREGEVVARGPGRWMIRWSLGCDESTGRYKAKSKTVRGTRRDAEKELRRILRSQDEGLYVEPSKVTVDAFLDVWLEAMKSKVTTRTWTDYEYSLKKYACPLIGTCRLDKLTPIEVQEMISKLTAKGLGPRTVQMAHRILKSALKHAVSMRMLVTNPAEGVSVPRVQCKEMRPLSIEEVGRFLQAARKDRWGVLFVLALFTGMRPSEYCGLRWKDFDPAKGCLTVNQVLARRRGGWEFNVPKTKRSRRTIPLPPDLIAALEQHRRDQEAHAKRIGAAYDQTLDLVFANEVGQPLLYRNLVRRHFKPILAAANIPSVVRLYDLRHTCATLMLESGINVKVVSERLGHASAAMTLDVYAHVLPGMQKEATEKLSSVLPGLHPELAQLTVH